MTWNEELTMKVTPPFVRLFHDWTTMIFTTRKSIMQKSDNISMPRVTVPHTLSGQPSCAGNLIAENFMKYVVGLLLSAVFLPAIAAAPKNMGDFELTYLPPYCVDTEWFKGGPRYSNYMSPRAPYWQSVMGVGFYWMHHYCAAIVLATRAESMSVTDIQRRYHLLQAVGEYTFTIKQLRLDFVLLPEIYTRLGEAQLNLSDFGAAYSSFLRAREIKPDYWPAYSRWAAVLIKTGQKREAEELVRTGLKYSPDSVTLMEQYRSLGGDPSKIVPAKESLSQPAASAKEEDAAGARSTPPASK